MSSLNLRLPDSLHEQVRTLAKGDGISINQFITLAVSEKVATLVTLDYIAERARRANREKFEHALQQIAAADNDAVPEDALPDDLHWLTTAAIDQIIAQAISADDKETA